MKNKHFYIKFNDCSWLKKSDILLDSNGRQVVVLKVYKNTKIRRWFNNWNPFRIKLRLNEVKVSAYKT